MIDAGLLDPASMITRTIPLAEAPAELVRLGKDPGDDVKVLVEVGGS
jgi:threonine dehydrogenase-like Zn-dependent dehydrogenase